MQDIKPVVGGEDLFVGGSEDLFVSEAAELAGVTTQTILSWIHSGRLKSERVGRRGIYLVKMGDLKRVMKRRRPMALPDSVYAAIDEFEGIDEGTILIFISKGGGKHADGIPRELTNYVSRLSYERTIACLRTAEDLLILRTVGGKNG